MIIFLKETNTTPLYDSKVFPGGEQFFRWDPNEFESTAVVTLQMQRFNYPLLAMAVDALKRLRPDIGIQLFLPYFPGARQDRVCEKGESLSSKVYAEMLNALFLDKVIIMDPHSDVAPALIDRCQVISHGQVYHHWQRIEVLDWLEDERVPRLHQQGAYVVAPDAGAAKKVLAAISRSSAPDRWEFAQGTKVRDTVSGRLLSFGIDVPNFEGRSVIIMDDINCNGGTFLGLAQVLKKRNAGDITLFTTHTDHDKGLLNMLQSDLMDGVVTTNSQDPFEGSWSSDVMIFDVFGE